MYVDVTKLVDLKLARRACAFTMYGSNVESKISLEKIYQCEHSPIRTQMFWVEMCNIPTFVSVHLVRHKIGVEHYVSTRREDRGATEVADRNTLVNHAMLINAQSLINLARKRMCFKASKETREVVNAIHDEICLIDPELARRMVPECVYRGGCYELKPCGKMPFSKERREDNSQTS